MSQSSSEETADDERDFIMNRPIEPKQSTPLPGPYGISTTLEPGPFVVFERKEFKAHGKRRKSNR